MKSETISVLFTFTFTMCFFGLTLCDYRNTATTQPIRVTFDNEEMQKSFPE